MKKIVAIVDDWERLERIEDRLGSRYQVHCAPFGAQGVQTAIEEKPDLILLDLEFEDMNEEEALALIRAQDSLVRVPVVIISNSGSSIEQDPLALTRVFVRPVSIESLYAFAIFLLK